MANKIEPGTFAEACYNSNSIAELRTSLAGEPDQYDCEEWGITATEWREAISEALAAKGAA